MSLVVSGPKHDSFSSLRHWERETRRSRMDVALLACTEQELWADDEIHQAGSGNPEAPLPSKVIRLCFHNTGRITGVNRSVSQAAVTPRMIGVPHSIAPNHWRIVGNVGQQSVNRGAR